MTYRAEILFAALLTAVVVSGHARADDGNSNPNAQPVLKTHHSARFAGSSQIIIYDVRTGQPTRQTLQGNDDTTLADFGTPPMNGVRFDIPVVPGQKQFARVEFNDGAVFCSSSVIGKRHLITAGHCVFDAGSFRRSALVFPGYSAGQAPIGSFRAARFYTFSGWADSQDYSHDIGVIELERDLPADVKTLPVMKPERLCGDGVILGFDRHFYMPAHRDQLVNNGGTYTGCKNRQLFYFLGTPPGSSGSAAVRQGSTEIYAIRSNFVGPVGYDTWLTPAKLCYITTLVGSPQC